MDPRERGPASTESSANAAPKLTTVPHMTSFRRQQIFHEGSYSRGNFTNPFTTFASQNNLESCRRSQAADRALTLNPRRFSLPPILYQHGKSNQILRNSCPNLPGTKQTHSGGRTLHTPIELKIKGPSSFLCLDWTWSQRRQSAVSPLGGSTTSHARGIPGSAAIAEDRSI